MVRLPPGARNFSATFKTSRQSIALWYWSSSFLPVVFGATSEVIRWHFLSQIDSRKSAIFLWVSGLVMSPTRVVIFCCGNFSTSCKSIPSTLHSSPTIFESTWSQLPGAQPRSITTDPVWIRGNFSCIWRSLKALLARYHAAFARWNHTSCTWYPALLGVFGAVIFFFFMLAL